MALIVEDNTGLANAQTYVSVDDFNNYCIALLRDTSSFDESAAEAALMSAFQFINTNWVYKSFPVNNDQAGEFPRTDLSDGAGRIFNTVPQRVKDAQCELGWVALTEALFQNLDRGGMITHEAVGHIQTTYAPGAPGQKQFTAAMRLVEVFARDPNKPRRPLPFAGGPNQHQPIFDVGMMDNHEIG